jgi:Fe-S-cluster-containing hydrogenase component 2
MQDEKCSGCALCVAACPGLAIFVLDKSYSDKVGSVSFPYEYLPVPGVGSEVDAVDRSGETVCKGKVKKVVLTKKSDRTTVMTVEVPIEFVDEIRGIKRL